MLARWVRRSVPAQPQVELEQDVTAEARTAAMLGFLATELCRDRRDHGDAEVPIIGEILDV